MTARFIGSLALASMCVAGAGVAASRADVIQWRPSSPDPLLPPVEAVLLPARSQDAAEQLADRLGFAKLLLAGNAWTVTSRLTNAALVWYDPATHLRFGLARPTEVAPVVAHRPPRRLPVLPVAYWEDVPASAMPHPNGAKTLLGITAVTDHLDRTCDRWWKSWDGHPAPFAPATIDTVLGARSRVGNVVAPNGTILRVRVLEPGDRYGVAGRLLSQGGPRWVGVTIGVEDVALEARRLARVNVRVTLVDVGTPGGPRLCIDPRDAGGTLIEFVPDPVSVVRSRGVH